MQGIYNYIPETNRVSRVYSCSCSVFTINATCNDIFLVVAAVDLITLHSIYQLGNLHLPKTAGGIMLNQGKEIHPFP